eukprot:gene12346-12480_t
MKSVAETRLQLLSRQLCATVENQGLLCNIPDICPEQLNLALRHDHRELRAAVLDHLKGDDVFKPNGHLSLMEYRELTMRRVQRLAAATFPDGKGLDVLDTVNGPRRFLAIMECLVYCDYSLTLKAAVHYSLCGATICKLGTDKHMAALVDRLNSLELFGCFGMT